MMYDNSQTVNPMLNIGMQAVNVGFKVGGEVAKALLLAALEKIKETKENKVGLTSLKNLAKSKDELNILSIKKENLDYFKKQCKKVSIPFAAVKGDGDNVKVLYKSKDVNMVKDILTDLLKQEKANKLDEFQEKTVYDFMTNNMDFKSMDDNFHREEVKGTTNEKATAIGDILRANNIDNDIVVTGVNEDNTFNIHYKIDEKDKDKAVEIINANKDKSIEEILNELERVEAERIRPVVINDDKKGLAKYGVEIETKEYEDKWGNKKETYSMKLNDKEVNHALEERHYSSIEDTLKRLGFSKEQIEELKKEDSFVQTRLKKEDAYLNILNKSNDGKEPLDNQIARAEKQKQQNTKDKQATKNKTKTKSKSEKERD